ncbi:MAG: hypothetical protein M3N23_07930 [Pseudomonadota bacterium]|nr:hypothetical protein [Pseudomonadota bacterium]
MTMPSMPDLPGAGAVKDTLEFMKNLWGNVKVPGMNLPGMVMPTLSVEEIDKQIADLKAVESWLTLNMNMLHGTIKALEVQSATLSTLQSMSANFSAAMQPQSSAPVAAADDSPPFESPFARAFAPPPAPASAAAAAEPASAPTSTSSKDTDSGSPAAAPIPLANPAAWWNMLQDQFKQAVASAAVVPSVAPGKAKGARATPSKTAVKGATKPAAKSSGASTAKRAPSTAAKKPAKRKST